MTKRYIAFLMIICLTLGLYGCNSSKNSNNQSGSSSNKNVKSSERASQAKGSSKELNLYYSNHDDYNFLRVAIDELKSSNPDVTINAYYQSSDDYIEKLVRYNNTDSVADIYLITESDLEKAYLAGITTQNNSKKYSNSANYGVGAMNACTYKGKMISYPLYFSTQVMIFNDNFDIHLPSSYEELKEMTGAFEVKEGMILEHILGWDISDMNINYSFIGGYIDACGVKSDDSNSITLNSDKAVNSANYMKDLAGFFNINRENITKDKIIESFAAGRSAFALVSTDDLAQLNKAIEATEGEKIDYTIATIPTIDNDSYKDIKPLSETVMMVVNPFSTNTDLATSVADFFSDCAKEHAYAEVGKIPARITDEIGGVPCSAIYAMYDESQPHIKLMNVGDFYTRLDIAFHNICDGSDTKEILTGLQTYLTGNMK